MFSGHSASSCLQLHPLVVIADEHVPLIADEHVPLIADEHVPLIADEHVPLIADEHVPYHAIRRDGHGRSRVVMFSGRSASSGLQLRPLVVIADEHVPYHAVRRDGAVSRHALHASVHPRKNTFSSSPSSLIFSALN
ncbi:hypothetical protein B0O80DRAFT_429033 [Mortierella sp. GBAus27b]|nr:hypothetical protein B0O80DRAFT_429033 [Mortierella sp. GBAus27b]